LIQCH